MYYYHVTIESFIELLTIAVAVYGLWHQRGIIKEQKEEIKGGKSKIEEQKKEIEEQRKESQDRRDEIRQLQQEKSHYQKEIVELTDIKNTRSLELVQEKLKELNPPLCEVCRHLLALRVATTLNGATQPFVELGKLANRNPKLKVDRRVLNALENAITGNLWQISLIHDRKPEDFYQQAIKTYSKLICNLRGDELKDVIRFCERICFNQNGLLLQQEAVLRLLPIVLVASDGAAELVEVYTKLLEELPGTHSEEEKSLLGSIFGSLVDAISVRPGNVTKIWALMFSTVKSDVEWAWGQKKGINIGGLWCIAMEKRLQYASKEEKEALRDQISDYLILDKARFHQLSYHPLSQLLGGGIRKAIDPKDRGYRQINRAVVVDMEIPVEILLQGSSSAIKGRLVNFSLEQSEDKTVGNGVWAAASHDQELNHKLLEQHNATVNILYPPGEGKIVFERAKVTPSEEKELNKLFWGFRIELGSSSPEDAVAALMELWKDPNKR